MKRFVITLLAFYFGTSAFFAPSSSKAMSTTRANELHDLRGAAVLDYLDGVEVDVDVSPRRGRFPERTTDELMRFMEDLEMELEIERYDLPPRLIETGDHTPPPIDVAPENDYVTRADFAKISIDRIYPEQYIQTCFDRITPSSFWLLFTDLEKDAWYGLYVCTGMVGGIIHGHDDGTFRGNNFVNLAEASKMLVRTFGMAYPYVSNGDRQEWYEPYVRELSQRGIIPTTIRRFDQRITTDEMLEMIWRIEEDATDQPATRIWDLR